MVGLGSFCLFTLPWWLLILSTRLSRYAVLFVLFRGGYFYLRPAQAAGALTFVGCDKSKQKRAFIPFSLYEQDRSGGLVL